jgi:hypothetical protein
VRRVANDEPTAPRPVDEPLTLGVDAQFRSFAKASPREARQLLKRLSIHHKDHIKSVLGHDKATVRGEVNLRGIR